MKYKIEACCLICEHSTHQNDKMMCDDELPTPGVIEVQPTWWCIHFALDPHLFMECAIDES